MLALNEHSNTERAQRQNTYRLTVRISVAFFFLFSRRRFFPALSPSIIFKHDPPDDLSDSVIILCCSSNEQLKSPELSVLFVTLKTEKTKEYPLSHKVSSSRTQLVSINEQCVHSEGKRERKRVQTAQSTTIHHASSPLNCPSNRSHSEQ